MAVIDITNSNFNEVISGGQAALIEFQAPWCTYCRRIGPAFQKVAEQYEGKLLVGAIDIDVSPELAKEYQVEYVPTLMVFKDGQPVGSIVAPGSKAQIEELIQAHLEV